MLIWKSLRCIDYRQFLKLSLFFIGKPLYIIPTFRATEETLKICNAKFSKKHHLDNKENAFRHALWNFLLCRYFFQQSGSLEKALSTSKKITDLHENIMPNTRLPRLMDLHNNKIGRSLFSNNSQLEIVNELEQMMHEARKLESEIEIMEAGNFLIYLED